MNNTINTFTFIPGVTLRCIAKDGQPWFVAIDLCAALGWSKENLKKHFSRNVSAEERGVIKVPTLKGMQGHSIVSESGLYKLVMRSTKPEAQQFQQWITADVLPAIRKDGAYVMGEEKVLTGEMSEEELISKALLAVHAKAERLAKENVQLKADNAVMHKELNVLTVDEWRSLNHLYFVPGQAISIGKRCRTLCEAAGIKVGKQMRVLQRHGREIVTYIGEYPRHILDQAARQVGLLA